MINHFLISLRSIRETPVRHACLLLFLIGLSVEPIQARQPATLKVHLIGIGEYSPQESLTKLKHTLEAGYLVECTQSFKLTKGRLDNLESLKTADLLVIFARRMKLPPDQMMLIRQHWEQGKPIIGIRTASHAFQKEDNEIFDRKVLGGNYFGEGDGKVIVSPEAAKHPVLRGVEPIKRIKGSYAYAQGKLANDVIVLQAISTRAITWVHTYKGGRVFYTSAGTPEDFQEANLLRMLTNAVFWTTQRDPEKLKK